MVVIGTLTWNVNVEGAAEAKKQAQEVGGSVEGTGEAAQDTNQSLLGLIGAYAGLENILGETTNEQEEQQEETESLASDLFFLGSIVWGLMMKYTVLGKVVGTVTDGFSMLVGVGKTLYAVGSVLVGWASSFVTWLAAGTTGALATAAAIGALLGMFVVWIMEITGVIDKIMGLGNVLNLLPGWAKDAITVMIMMFSGFAALLGGIVIGFVEGGFSGAWKRAEQIIDIFGGAFIRTFERLAGFVTSLFSGDILGEIYRMKDQGVSAISRLIDRARVLLSGFGDQVGRYISEGVRGGFNSAVPSQISLPEINIRGKTFGGQTLNLPQLEQGGMVAETGLAKVHEGETYIPRDVRKSMDGGDGGSGDKVIKIDIGGVEIGDQSLDLRSMGRTELRDLAEQIAEILGGEVDTAV